MTRRMTQATAHQHPSGAPQISALIAGVALASLLVAGEAGANDRTVSVAHLGGPAAVAAVPARQVCYGQTSGASQIGIVSQKFLDEGDNIYDSRGADDFSLTSSCLLRAVDVTAQYFDGSGPAEQEQVIVYADDDGAPGRQLTRQTLVGKATDSTGSFRITLTKPLSLDAGPYWLSVRADMAFGNGSGEWGWETSTIQTGYPAVWRNPLNGLGTGCTTYGLLSTCTDEPGISDFLFTLEGTR